MSRKKGQESNSAQAPQSDPWGKWWESVPVDDAEHWDFLNDQTAFLNEIKAFNTQRLRNAKDVVSQATDEIDLETFDAKEYPVDKLANLIFETDEYNEDPLGIFIDENNPFKSYSVSNLLDTQLFRVLKCISIASALPEAVEKLKDLAPKLIRLLMEGRRFFTKKIALANAIGYKSAAKKLEDARKEFCMIELSGDIDTNTKRLFLERKITPDEFRAAMRHAFMLDGEATAEINDGGNVVPTPRPVSTTVEPAPHDLKILQGLAATKNAVEQLTVRIDAANSKLDTLSDWWEDWKKHGKHISRRNSTTSEITINMLKAIKTKWKEYKTVPIDTSPILPTKNRKPGEKRNLEEFIANMGDNKIFKDKSLNEILDVGKKDDETRLETLKRLLDSIRKNDKRHP